MIKANANPSQAFNGYYTIIHKNENNPAKIGKNHGLPYQSIDFKYINKLLAERVYIEPKLEDKFEAAVDNSSYEIHHKASDQEYPGLYEYSNMALDLLMHYPFIKRQLDEGVCKTKVSGLGFEPND